MLFEIICEYPKKEPVAVGSMLAKVRYLHDQMLCSMEFNQIAYILTYRSGCMKNYGYGISPT